MSHARQVHRPCKACRLSLSALATAIVLLGCATEDPLFRKVLENAKPIGITQACCASLQSILAAGQALGLATIELAPSTPHFDFGQGNSPFVAYRLAAGTKTIEAEAPLQLLGWAYGGDGAARYVDVVALFFDPTGQRLPSRLLERGQSMTGPGARSLFHYFAVPERASHVVITTDPTKYGLRERGPIYNQSAMPVTSGSTTFLISGGVLPYGYVLASYGPVKVRSLGSS